MVSFQRKLKNLVKYHEKRYKEKLRLDLYEKIQEASLDCGYVPLKKQIEKNRQRKNYKADKENNIELTASNKCNSTEKNRNIKIIVNLEHSKIFENHKRKNSKLFESNDCEKSKTEQSIEHSKFFENHKRKNSKLFESNDCEKSKTEQSNHTIAKKSKLMPVESKISDLNLSQERNQSNIERQRFKQVSTEISTKTVSKARSLGIIFDRPTHIIEQRKKLPIFFQEDEIISAIRHNSVVFIDGTTGCGKSTQIPQMLLEHGFEDIIMTQPKKISCISISQRINYETSANFCAFRHRFGNNLNSDTKIEIVTEGILLKELIKDIKLSQYKTVIIDESHDITLNLDVIIPILSLLSQRRADLRFIYMSATQNTNLLKIFPSAPTISIQSTLFVVKTHYYETSMNPNLLNTKFHGKEMFKLEDEIFNLVKRLIYIQNGDILIFIPSKDQIYSLLSIFKKTIKNCVFLPFHSSLSQKEQQSIFTTERKCILATNYAETGLTIPGIIHVIDSGLQKICHDNGHIRSYSTVLISKSSANQRKGRAGRTSEGNCYRMYTPGVFESMKEHLDPAIHRSSVDFHILLLYYFKIKKQIFVNPIPIDRLKIQNKMLEQMHLIKNNKATKLGRRIVQSRFSLRCSIMLQQYNTNCMRMVCAILDSDIELKVQLIDKHSETFAKIDHFFELAQLKAHCGLISPQRIREILYLADLTSEKIIFTEEVKNKIAQCISLVFYDHLCIRVGDDFYYNTKKVYLTREQQSMKCERFVFQYLLERNGKFYPYNITKAEEEWFQLIDSTQ